MIYKTDALVLNITPYSNTSRIVTWLTPEAGRLTTMIKGACRPKSPFLGQFDYFYTCELLYYQRQKHGLCIARACTPLRFRPRFRTDWRAYACASYLTHLVHHSSYSGHHGAIFQLAEKTLDLLESEGASLPLLLWAELALLELLGVSPQVDLCVRCRCSIDASRGRAFSERAGGLVCVGCLTPHDTAIELSADLVSLVRRWQQAADFRMLRTTQLTSQQILVFKRIMGIFLAYHLESPPEYRDMAFALAAASRGTRHTETSCA